jgi:hypothetical protein
MFIKYYKEEHAYEEAEEDGVVVTKRGTDVDLGLVRRRRCERRETTGAIARLCSVGALASSTLKERTTALAMPCTLARRGAWSPTRTVPANAKSASW